MFELIQTQMPMRRLNFSPTIRSGPWCGGARASFSSPPGWVGALGTEAVCEAWGIAARPGAGKDLSLYVQFGAAPGLDG